MVLSLQTDLQLLVIIFNAPCNQRHVREKHTSYRILKPKKLENSQWRVKPYNNRHKNNIYHERCKIPERVNLNTCIIINHCSSTLNIFSDLAQLRTMKERVFPSFKKVIGFKEKMYQFLIKTIWLKIFPIKIFSLNVFFTT